MAHVQSLIQLQFIIVIFRNSYVRGGIIHAMQCQLARCGPHASTQTGIFNASHAIQLDSFSLVFVYVFIEVSLKVYLK